MQLKQATEHDKPFLLELRKSTMVEHLEAMGLYLTEEQHVARSEEHFDCIHIVECRGRRTGMVKTREVGQSFEIRQLQVLPEFQGKGIGRAVMQLFIESARSRGKTIVLTVLKKNPAKRLHEKLGFCVVGEDDHEFHMRREP
ncbi:MAG: GNAT family N-acetyltransferase [Proteobacteria bacterium]|nr:GNAT family N-acetyltransferase [Pseudomonadota bacterium]